MKLQASVTEEYALVAVSAGDTGLRVAVELTVEQARDWSETLLKAAEQAERKRDAAFAAAVDRCAWCGWTLAGDASKGCVRGNCSMRPLPTSLFDAKRALAEARSDYTRQRIVDMVSGLKSA